LSTRNLNKKPKDWTVKFIWLENAYSRSLLFGGGGDWTSKVGQTDLVYGL